MTVTKPLHSICAPRKYVNWSPYEYKLPRDEDSATPRTPLNILSRTSFR